ncbi:hypothetical protein ACLOJK_034284 [Asimina triloba]
MLAALYLSLFLPSAIASASNDCVYVLYVETGSVENAGTHAKISVVIGDIHGREMKVNDLKSWGLMGSSYKYFQKGKIDSFGGRGACLNGPPCHLKIASDYSGACPSWYCDVVEVTATGPHDSTTQTIFYVNQWFSKDRPPYQLSTARDYCYNMVEAGEHGRLGMLLVGNPLGRLQSPASQ